MSNGWSWYVSILVIGNILGCVWLLWWMRRGRGESAPAGTETTGYVWDGDLREYNSPLPRWWLWLFILSIVFAAGYLVLYPGLGNRAGTLGWTSHGEHAVAAAENEARIQQTLAPYEARTVESLATDPAAIRIGRNLFLNNCAQCHGSDGRGAPGFPNLTDADWLWGGTTATIVETITNGRNAAMPPWRDVIGPAGVDDAVAYVLSLSGRTAPIGNVAKGREEFATYCVACHGADGRGNQLLGAPNLTDAIWLYGGSVASIRDSIGNGRQGAMPAHGERLGATRIKLLAAFVLSIGPPTTPASAAPALSSAALPQTEARHAGTDGS